MGSLDITMYRDDLATRKMQPVPKATDIAFDIQDKIMVLVDDVIFTGRTIRAALNSVMDYGRPRRIQLAVLVDEDIVNFRSGPTMWARTCRLPRRKKWK